MSYWKWWYKGNKEYIKLSFMCILCLFIAFVVTYGVLTHPLLTGAILIVIFIIIILFIAKESYQNYKKEIKNE